MKFHIKMTFSIVPYSFEGSTTYQSGLSKTATYTTPKLALLTTQNPTSLRTKTPELRTTNFMITSITPAHSHLLPQQAIHTACEPDKWNITIDMTIMMSIYPGIQKDDIYLGNFACKGTMESNMILVFDQGLQNCSTVETVCTEMRQTPHKPKHMHMHKSLADVRCKMCVKFYSKTVVAGLPPRLVQS